MFDALGPTPLTLRVRIALGFWCTLLPSWLMFALIGTGMAFEGGYTPGAYWFAWSVWIFPILVPTSFFYRRKKPALVWLPGAGLVCPFLLAPLFG
jgi:hypothetical protein